MARPKLNDNEARTINFTIRLSPDESLKLKEAAELSSVTLGEFIRAKVFTEKFPQPKSALIDRKTYYELRKIGVNLNQLARQANRGIVPIGLEDALLRLTVQQDDIIKLLFHDRQPEDR